MRPTDLLTVSDLCRALAPWNDGKPVARSTVYRWLPKGLPVAKTDKVTGHRYFLLQAVVAWRWPD